MSRIFRGSGGDRELKARKEQSGGGNTAPRISCERKSHLFGYLLYIILQKFTNFLKYFYTFVDELLISLMRQQNLESDNA